MTKRQENNREDPIEDIICIGTNKLAIIKKKGYKYGRIEQMSPWEVRIELIPIKEVELQSRP